MVRIKDIPALQVNVTLRDIEPAVWRRLVLPGAWHLGQVHQALQVAFDWNDEHLHLFECGDASYGVDLHDDGSTRRESVARLHEVLPEPGDAIAYWYDFGDDWYHDIVLEQQLEPEQQARCLDGRRAAPPEDSGGPWGYQGQLAAFADPKNPDHADAVEWLGDSFDPELVDVAGIDAVLRRIS